MWCINLLACAGYIALAAALPSTSKRRSGQYPPKAVGSGIPLTGRYVTEVPHDSLSPRQNLAEVNTNFHYFTTLSLGTQSRTYQVLVDTGSPDLVIFSSGVTLPDPDLSDQSLSCAEAYGNGGATGSVSGETYNGPYSFAGLSTSGLFCLGSSSNSNPNAQDGILGLAQIPQAQNPKTVSGQTGNNPVTAGPLGSFGIYLSSSSQNGVGQLTPNGADANYYQDEDSWTYEDVNMQPNKNGNYLGFWQFTYSAWSINGVSGNPPLTLGLIDTGTASIRLDPDTANAIYGQIGAPLPTASSARPRIDCSYQGNAPDIVFTFGSGATYTIPSSIYVEPGPAGGCTLAIVASPDASYPNIFGAPFVQAYYSWFDSDDQVIGFNPSVG